MTAETSSSSATAAARTRRSLSPLFGALGHVIHNLNSTSCGEDLPALAEKIKKDWRKKMIERMKKGKLEAREKQEQQQEVEGEEGD